MRCSRDVECWYYLYSQQNRAKNIVSSLLLRFYSLCLFCSQLFAYIKLSLINAWKKWRISNTFRCTLHTNFIFPDSEHWDTHTHTRGKIFSRISKHWAIIWAAALYWRRNIFCFDSFKFPFSFCGIIKLWRFKKSSCTVIWYLHGLLFHLR